MTRSGLPSRRRPAILARMWDEPYLETCCRSALHRLLLAGDSGRPPGLQDYPCLRRLCAMGFSAPGPDQRYRITAAGRARHATEIQPARQLAR